MLFDVPRAFASTKMHYFTKLKKRIEAGELMRPTEWKFEDAFPDSSPASGGTQPLSEEGWETLRHEMRLQTKADWVKHILTKHDGEVRLVGYSLWAPFPASGGNVANAKFWSYQFASDPEVRRWLADRDQEDFGDLNLSSREINWMMWKLEDESTVLKRSYNPASGGYEWFIRTGNCITLAELFYFGGRICSCYDLCRTFLDLPIFLHKRHHSVSNTAEAQLRRNAKALRYHEGGQWSLPKSR